MRKPNGGGFAALIAAVFLFAGVTCAPGAGAQTYRGNIRGTVMDPSGAVVVGAKVRAKNTATGETRETTSDANGDYVLPELDAGLYEVIASFTGFTPTPADAYVE